jgi:hypothetical protein
MPRLHTLPHLQRLEFLSSQNQARVAAYLRPLQARQYAPATLRTTRDAINSFCMLIPAIQQPRLSPDLAYTTANDLDAWLHAAHRKGLAPSTIHHLLSVRHRFFPCLQAQGPLLQQPIPWRRHQVLVPQARPRPMAEEDLIRFFQVMDSRRDRTMFLLMWRCGLRGGSQGAHLARHACAGGVHPDRHPSRAGGSGGVGRPGCRTSVAPMALLATAGGDLYRGKSPQTRPSARRPSDPAPDGQVSHKGPDPDALCPTRPAAVPWRPNGCMRERP